ncbi:MAG: DNA polymerase I, partial [Nitrospinaceae bacterium]|nr:DNA polymerase I [Nitrospinaceae bacterium]NIR57841.1 DNA polymerase I [Nitrospinaceae bacterium]NIS88304.1 DNA polymerase I [Nitrospinaceae bacterium]NIT85182.1 DNA polymerase I [Nitrospinaceae bacterium]NIU47332.1 DNA polymerase I [Nitrospinaceae bacterium]
QYKANREVPPEDLQAQMPYFEPLVQAYNIATLQKDGFEADDIIGTLARKAEKEGLEVVIVSGDKDLMQLLGPHVHMLDTMKNKRFEPKDVKEKFGVSPEKVIEVLGLMGDSSDNVPGIKGVGPKTATDLIQKFGSIEDLYQNLDEIEKKKLQEKLESEKKKAFLSRELVTIDTGMDLDVSLENLQMKEVNKAELRKLYEEFEFKSLLSQIGEEAENETPPEAGKPRRAQGKHQYRAILTEEAFESLLKDLKSSKEFALDLETDSLYPVEAEPVGISFCHRAREAWYIPVGHDYLGAPDQLDRKEVFRKLKPVLENSKVAKIGHNIKYDLIVLKNQGVDLQGVSFDTMLASYVLDPGRRSHGLDDLAQEFLGHKNITYKDVTGTGSKQVGFGKVDIETATEYAAEDSDVTWRLYEKIEPQLDADARNLLDEIDLPLMEVLAEMELTGVYIDGKHLQDLSKAMEKKLHAYEKEIFKIAGEEFNINSPKQLSVILFEKLKLPVVKKTKTGYSTDVSVLEELAPDHELPEKILNYRQLGKLKS